MTKKFALAAALAAVLAAVIAMAGGCAANNSWQQVTGAVWGTTYTLKWQGRPELADSAIAQMRQVELALSMFDPASNISRINRGETDTLSPMGARVFSLARRVSLASGGAYDPTVAPLVDLWGFGRDKSARTADTAPDSAAIAAALARVGMAQCGLDSVTLTVSRKHPQTQFDFSSIAKGFGVDCVAAALKRNGVENFMVEIGGEMSLAGHSPAGRDWNIQIDGPDSGRDGHSALEVLPLTDCAVATSGNYRNFRTLADGTRATHTLDPRTGRPVATNTLTVTVIAPDCALADALATACMAMPAADAVRMLKAMPGVRAHITTTAREPLLVRWPAH